MNIQSSVDNYQKNITIILVYVKYYWVKKKNWMYMIKE